jgi:hypothetical protein
VAWISGSGRVSLHVGYCDAKYPELLPGHPGSAAVERSAPVVLPVGMPIASSAMAPSVFIAWHSLGSTRGLNISRAGLATSITNSAMVV